MTQPNPATESAEQHTNHRTWAEIKASRPTPATETSAVPPRPEPEWMSTLYENSKYDNYMIVGSEVRQVIGEYRRAIAQLSAALEREKEKDEEIEKLDDEVQCAMGANGIQFHIMRRLGLECLDLDKWQNVRAEQAEAERDRLRELLDKALLSMSNSSCISTNMAAIKLRAALTPPAPKEKP